MKYLTSYIENSNVTPLPKHTITNILNAVKSLEPDAEQLKIMSSAINEANRMYYYAYKKSILDYILKDEGERERTGIEAIFDPPLEWGAQHRQREQLKHSPVNKERISKSIESILCYSRTIQEISDLNLLIKDVNLFRIKNRENKPMNVLYFIKKQNTHTSEIISYLGTEWIKNAAEIIKKTISLDE